MKMSWMNLTFWLSLEALQSAKQTIFPQIRQITGSIAFPKPLQR